MKRKFNSTIAVLYVLVCGLVFYRCSGKIVLAPSPMPTSFQTQYAIVTNSPGSSTTAAITTTPTLSSTLMITPEELFSISGLQVLSTPGSEGFCENIPTPQIIQNPNELSILVGRFSLCPSRSWPWVNMAMDLDTGTLVSVDNESADMVMEYAHVPLDGTISYDLQGLNNGHIAKIATSALNYEYCEETLQPMDESNPGIFDINDGTLACAITTENRIAVIRVEKIYPLDTQSVEFSFAVLRK